MKMKTVILVIICSSVAALKTHSCKYWCKSDREHTYYCCPSGKTEKWISEAVWPMMFSSMFWLGVIGTTIGMHVHGKPHTEEKMRKKYCPPIRSACPRSLDWYDPPKFCYKDDECHPTEKCCYDVCLEHKACKPAE